MRTNPDIVLTQIHQMIEAYFDETRGVGVYRQFCAAVGPILKAEFEQRWAEQFPDGSFPVPTLD